MYVSIHTHIHNEMLQDGSTYVRDRMTTVSFQTTVSRLRDVYVHVNVYVCVYIYI